MQYCILNGKENLIIEKKWIKITSWRDAKFKLCASNIANSENQGKYFAQVGGGGKSSGTHPPPHSVFIPVRSLLTINLNFLM